VIDKVFAFEETAATYRQMASGAHFGKIEGLPEQRSGTRIE